MNAHKKIHSTTRTHPAASYTYDVRKNACPPQQNAQNRVPLYIASIIVTLTASLFASDYYEGFSAYTAGETIESNSALQIPVAGVFASSATNAIVGHPYDGSNVYARYDVTGSASDYAITFSFPSNITLAEGERCYASFRFALFTAHDLGTGSTYNEPGAPFVFRLYDTNNAYFESQHRAQTTGRRLRLLGASEWVSNATDTGVWNTKGVWTHILFTFSRVGTDVYVTNVFACTSNVITALAVPPFKTSLAHAITRAMFILHASVGALTLTNATNALDDIYAGRSGVALITNAGSNVTVYTAYPLTAGTTVTLSNEQTNVSYPAPTIHSPTRLTFTHETYLPSGTYDIHITATNGQTLTRAAAYTMSASETNTNETGVTNAYDVGYDNLSFTVATNAITHLTLTGTNLRGGCTYRFTNENASFPAAVLSYESNAHTIALITIDVTAGTYYLGVYDTLSASSLGVFSNVSVIVTTGDTNVSETTNHPRVCVGEDTVALLTYTNTFTSVASASVTVVTVSGRGVASFSASIGAGETRALEWDVRDPRLRAGAYIANIIIEGGGFTRRETFPVILVR